MTAIGSGDYSNCALVNGAVKCWGWNAFGKLGNNSTVDSAVPVQSVGLTDGVTALAIGWEHSCVLAGGNIKCWGREVYGALGNNLAIDEFILVPTAVSIV